MKSYLRLSGIGLAGLLLAGCATSMGAKAENDSLKNQVATLEGQVGTLAQRIDEISQRQGTLEAQLQPGGNGGYTTGARTKTALTARDAQLALKNAGFYSGPVDGKVGPQTREAVKAFQRSQGLSPDGKVGSKTSLALAKYLGTSAE